MTFAGIRWRGKKNVEMIEDGKETEAKGVAEADVAEADADILMSLTIIAEQQGFSKGRITR